MALEIECVIWLLLNACALSMPNPLLDVIRQPFSGSHAAELKMDDNDRGARSQSWSGVTQNQQWAIWRASAQVAENIAVFPDRAEDLLLADVL